MKNTQNTDTLLTTPATVPGPSRPFEISLNDHDYEQETLLQVEDVFPVCSELGYWEESRKLRNRQKSRLQRRERRRQKTVVNTINRHQARSEKYAFEHDLIYEQDDDLVTQMFDTIRSLPGKIATSVDSVTSLMEQIRELVSGVSSIIDFARTSYILYNLVQAIYDRKWLSMGISMVFLLRDLNVTMQDFISVVELCVGYISGSETRLRTEMGEEIDWSRLLTCVKDGPKMLAILGLSVMLSLVRAGSLKSVDVQRYMADFGRTSVGFEKLHNLVDFLVRTAKDIYYRYYKGISYEKHQLMQEFEGFESVVKRLEILKDPSFKVQYLDRDVELCKAVLCLETDMDHLRRAAIMANNHVVKAMMGTEMAATFRIFEAARNSPAYSHQTRPLPTAAYIYGKAGVGKSNLLLYLIHKIYKRKYEASSEWSMANIAHDRKVENEFWDGYFGQPVVTYDDLLQAKDSHANPNLEVMEIIRVKNETPYQLHMSSIADKKNVFFTSSYVLASTNVKNPTPTSIAEPDAFTRRWDLAVEVGLKPQFTKKIGKRTVMDKTAVAAEVTKTGQAFVDVYEIREYDLRNSSAAAGAPMSLDEFCDRFFEIDTAVKQNTEALSASIAAITGVTHTQELEGMTEFKEKFITQMGNDASPEDDVEYCCEKRCRVVSSIRVPAIACKKCENLYVCVCGCIKVEGTIQIYTQMGSTTDPEEFQDAIPGDDSESEEDDDESLVGHLETLKELMQEPLDDIPDDLDEVENLAFALIRNTADCPAVNPLDVDVYQESTSLREKAINLCKQVASSPRVKRAATFASNLLSSVKNAVLNVCSQGMKLFATTMEWLWNNSKVVGLLGLILGLLGSTYYQMFNVVHYKSIPAGTDFSRIRSCDHPECELCRHTYQSKPGTEAFILERALHLGTLRPDLSMEISSFILSNLHNTSLTLYNDVMSKCNDYRQVQKAYEVESSEIRTRTVPSAVISESNEIRTSSKPALIVAESNEVSTSTAPSKLFAESSEVVTKGSPKPVFTEAAVLKCPVYVQMARETPVLKANPHDMVQLQQWESVVTKNMVRLEIEKCPDLSLNGVFVVGRTLLTTKHFADVCEQMGGLFRMVNPFQKEGSLYRLADCTVTQCTSRDGEPLDAILVSVPGVASRPNILSMFSKSRDLGKTKYSHAVVSGLRNVKGLLAMISFHSDKLHPLSRITSSSPDRSKEYLIRDGYTYDLDTRAGDCGSLVFIRNKGMSGKIVGMHVAGSGRMGTAQGISNEFLTRNLEVHANKCDSRLLVDGRIPFTQMVALTTKDELPGASLAYQGDCLSYGTLPAVHESTSSRVRPSLISGALTKPIMKPAYLHPVDIEGERVDPLIKGLTKVLNTTSLIDTDILDICVDDVKNTLGSRSLRVLTLEEGVKGVELSDYHAPINRITSPGYPYCMERQGVGKTAWLGNGEYDISAEVEEDVNQLLDCARNNQRGDVLWSATLKDERRPIEKVQQGKTRVFTAGPMHYTIATRMYFLDFIAFVMENRISNEIGVGTDPFSLDWHLTGQALSKYGKHVIAGDFSNFDGSLRQDILWKICDVINDIYQGTEEETLIRKVLFEEMCNARVLVRGEIVGWTHSQPSGNPMTVIINSLFNMIVMRYAYLLCKREAGFSLMCNFRQVISLQCFGDDNVLNIHSEVVEWYNQQTIAEALATIGLTYTDEAKTGELVKTRLLSDVHYLKRGFVKDNAGYFRGPLDISVCYEIANWMRVRGDSPGIDETHCNVCDSLRELSLHGERCFNEAHRVYSNALRKVGCEARLPSYKEVRSVLLLEKDWRSFGLQLQMGSHPSEVLIFPEDQMSCQSRNGGYDVKTISVNKQDEEEQIKVITQMGEHTQEYQAGLQTADPSETTDVSQDVQAAVPSTPMPAGHVPVSNAADTQHSIQDILSRYVLLDTYKWTTSDGILVQHLRSQDFGLRQGASYELPAAIIKESAIIREKLNNFYMMKCDIEFDIKVNSSRFMQGALLISYSPLHEGLQYDTTRFLASVSSLPNRVLSLEAASAVTFRVPYLQSADYFNLAEDELRMGILSIDVLSPLRCAVTPSEVSVIVRARLCNVKLEAATNHSISMNPHYFDVYTKELEDRLMKMKLFTQMGGEGATTGFVGKLAHAAGSVAKAVGSAALSVVGAPEWVARSASALAHGFSKPVDSVLAQIVRSKVGHTMCNTEGKDTSVTLGQIVDNSICSSLVNPEHEDEMALSYIFARPAIVARYTVDSDAFRDRKMLFAYSVGPIANYNISPYDTLSLSTASYAAGLFRYWRGSQVYNFDIVKTEYHSGRFVAVFFPGLTPDEVPGVLTDEITTNYNVIYDMTAKTGDEYSLSHSVIVPYVAPTPWRRTFKVTSAGEFSSPLDCTVGSVGVFAYSDLIFPDTVSPVVEFLLHYKPGGDFEVAYPWKAFDQGGQAGTDDALTAFIAAYDPYLESPTYSFKLSSEEAPGKATSAYREQDESWTFVHALSTQTDWPQKLAIELADGDYVFECRVICESADASLLYCDQDSVFHVSVTNNKISHCSSNNIVNLRGGSPSNVTIRLDVPLGGGLGTPITQMGGGAAEELSQDISFAPILSSNTVPEQTTGEYAKSLRPLTRRFSKIAIINTSQSIAYHPFMRYAHGTGANKVISAFGHPKQVPESWLSIISNIYAFYAGSYRLKAVGDFNTQFETGLTPFVTQVDEVSQPLAGAQHYQSGITDPLLEVNIPYYGLNRIQRIHSVADVGMPYISTSVSGVPLLEAAGDDLNFMFLIGPPVVTGLFEGFPSFKPDAALKGKTNCIVKNNAGGVESG
nr:polyprotein [Mute swan feces associated picorna-like virus 10]